MSVVPVTVIGSYISPYVRKVLVCLQLKGVPYSIDPIVPFFGNEEFARLSPLRRIPVLLDDRVSLSDSTVICEYLEERFPSPALLPEDPGQRARARWLEEYADTRMGEVIIWRLFNQLVIRRFVWREAPDEALLSRAREHDLPQVLGYLESQLSGGATLFEQLTVADVAIAALLRNAELAGYAVDAGRWPRTAAFAARVLGQEAFARLRPFEELALRTPIGDYREALARAGAPLSDKTWGGAVAQRGVMDVGSAALD